MIIFDASVPYQNYCTYFLKKPNKTFGLPFTQVFNDGSQTLRNRAFSRLNATQYQFRTGYLNGTVNNDICVPIQIIGLKKIL